MAEHDPERVIDLSQHVDGKDLQLMEARLKDNFQSWAEAHIEKALDGVNEEKLARLQSDLEAIKTEVHRTDVILRGETGRNGLASSLRMLEAAEGRREKLEERRDRRQWGILVLLVAVVLKEIVNFLVP